MSWWWYLVIYGICGLASAIYYIRTEWFGEGTDAFFILFVWPFFWICRFFDWIGDL